MRYGLIINQVNAGVVLGTEQYPTNLDDEKPYENGSSGFVQCK